MRIYELTHSHPKGTATAKLMFPNDTTVEIEGDIDVVTQILNALDGLTIGYTERASELNKLTGIDT